MVRLMSFLAAIVVLLSAAAEITSFAIDHRSWLLQQYQAALEYLDPVIRAKQPPEKECVPGDCGPKDKPELKDKPKLPRDLIRSEKRGDMANATSRN